MTRNVRGAVGGGEKASEHPHGRGLSSTVRAEEPDDVPFIDLE